MIALGNAGQLELNEAGLQARDAEAAANPEPTEDDLYAMDLDELKQRAGQAAADAIAARPVQTRDNDGSEFVNPFTGNSHAVKGGRRW